MEAKVTKIEYGGKSFEVDASAFHEFRFHRLMASAQEGDMRALFAAYDRLFMDRTDEYADALGGSIEEITALFSEAARAIGEDGEAKN